MNEQLLARRHFDEIAKQYDDYTLVRQGYVQALDNHAVELIRKHQLAKHLDVGCGTGRLLARIRSERLPCRSKGIDLSPKMVEQCREKGLDVSPMAFKDLETEERYDLITMQFNVFGYLISQQSMNEITEKILSLLSIGGFLFFDCMNPYCVTYSSLTKTLPLFIVRLVKSFTTRGILISRYQGRSETPAAMAMINASRLHQLLQKLPCQVEQIWVRYSNKKSMCWLPNILASHRLIIARRI